jgi:hypothetical protein
MYDTIHLRFDFKYNPPPKKGEVLAYIDNYTTVERHHNNTTTESGKIDNLTVSYNDQSIIIRGSLCKYYYGNNAETLTRETTKEAIDKLSNTLSFDVGLSDITRIDWSTNVSTTLPPSVYYPYLGHLDRYERNPFKGSLYYKQNTKEIIFYDKVLEAKAKGMEISEEFIGQHLFRYELRLLKNINKQLNQFVKAKDLYKETTYQKVGSLWYNTYTDIEKRPNKKNIIKDMSKSLNAKDLDKALMIQSLQSMGLEELFNQLLNLKHRGLLDDRTYYRKKKAYKKLIDVQIQEDDTIDEVDKLIKEVYDKLR